MAPADVTMLQRSIQQVLDRLTGLEDSISALDGRMAALENRMVILEHAFVGLAAQVDIRLRAVETQLEEKRT